MVQAGGRIALQGAGDGCAVADAEYVAALPSHDILKTLELETITRVVTSILHGLSSCAGKTGLSHATATAFDPAGIGASHTHQQIGSIARKVKNVATTAALDQINLVTAIGPGDLVRRLKGHANAVIQRDGFGLCREVKDVAATGVDDVCDTPVGQEAIGVIARAALHVRGTTTSNQQVIAATAHQRGGAGVRANQHVIAGSALQNIFAASGNEQHRDVQRRSIDQIVARTREGLDPADAGKSLGVSIAIGQNGADAHHATTACHGV